MTAWSHLPNAALIDEVLASLKDSPEKWSAAWNAAWDAARRAAWDAARDAAWDVSRGAVKDAARDAFWGAISALIAYDDAGRFMKLPVDHLRCLHRLDPHPMFLLLQPAAIVFTEKGDTACLG